MQDHINVRIATLKVVNNPNVLICRGLGSCVGVALWDSKKGIGGLAHVLLPSEEFSLKKDNPEKFADKSIDIMIERMTGMGSLKRNIIAKIAGGAKMFQSAVSGPDRVHVGERNVIAVKDKLEKVKVSIVAEDVGGNKGRTMEFDTRTGKVTIYLADKTRKVL